MKYVVELTEEEMGILKAAHFHIDAYGMPSWTEEEKEEFLVATLKKIIDTKPLL